uniref:Active regulator of SIRT1 n=1 Tax=Wuchereria bancrofti TaxID=6293 RepID=A0AAF5PVQ8_WUCBA
MSMKLLQEAIKLVDADDRVKNTETVRKSVRVSKAERDHQKLAAVLTTSEYDPELDDVIVNSNAQKQNLINPNRKKITKNISLLEESRLISKTDLLKRNIKYMVYETNCKLDPNKTKQMIGFMDEHNRRRKKILRALRKRNNGVRDYRWNFKKSKNKSIFTDEDFMKVGPDRIKLLRKKNAKKTRKNIKKSNHLGN